MTTTVLNVNSFKNEVIPYRSFTFSGGEIQVRVDTPLTPPKAVLIDANIRNASEIIEMLLVTDALKEALPVSTMFHLRCRYLPYARQDRVCSVGEAFSLRMMGDLINIQEYTSVTVWDVHSPVAKIGKSDWHGIKNLVNVTVSEMITKEVIGNSILVSPDKGAIDRVSGVANKFNRPMIVAEKIRDPNDGKITGTKICDEDRARINSGEINCDGGFLMVDDICDGGRTFIELAKVLQPMTTGKTRLYVTHGIFSQGFGVFENLIDEIITPNCFHEDVPNFVHIMKGV